MPKKTNYENDPWPDLKGFDIEDFKVIEDFLPSPEEMRKSGINVNGKPALYVSLSKKDMRTLELRAKRKGISPHNLAAAVLHAFVDHAS
jgi:hypothetical protein